MQVKDKAHKRNKTSDRQQMAKPQILVLANDDATIALTAAGFSIAGDDTVRRQTAAIVIDTRGEAGSKAGD